MSRLRDLGIAIDQLANVLLYHIKIGGYRLGSGKPDETLSGHFAQIRFGSAVADRVSRILERIDPDHAFDAIEYHPGTDTPEPHHMGDYEVRRVVEQAAAALALERDDLTDFAMEQAESAFRRQRLREKARDLAAGGIK